MCQIIPYPNKPGDFPFLPCYLSFFSTLGLEKCACEGSEEVLLTCGRYSLNYFSSLTQILKLGFVPLCYMWFVVAVENALHTLNCPSEKE